MARCNSFQYTKTFSINRENFLQTVVYNENLSKKELRVLTKLMTELDCLNYKEIAKKKMAKSLNMELSDFKDALYELMEHGVIGEGASESTERGYKLLF